MTEAESVENVEEDGESEQEQDPKVAIRIAFDEGVTEELEEDDVKLRMIGAGATFKNVTRLYNEFMIEAGLAISKSDRNQIVDEALDGLEFETEEDFDNAVKALIESLSGANLRSASALVRSHAKKTEVPCFTKPKGDSGTRNPFVTLFHESLIENPKMTEKDLKEIIESLDEKNRVNPLRWFNQHNNIRKTANAIAARYEA